MMTDSKFKDLASSTFYDKEVDDCIEMLDSSRNGLADTEIELRKEFFGANSLPTARPKTLIEVFFLQFKNPLIYVLLGATVISIFLEEYTDAMFIGLVLLLNAVIGTWQEYQAEKSAHALQQLIRIRTKVLRNDEELELDSQELVPGDIVLLESGNKVPADIRILDEKSMLVDESLLTGESKAVNKQIQPVAVEAGIGDRKSMLFAATTIVSGRCTGLVVKTGLSTEVGQIASTLKSSQGHKPPLVLRMEQFSKQVAYIILVVVLIIGVIVGLQGAGLEYIFLLTMTLAVSAIPEGLPVAVTVALSVAAHRMSKRNVIVRKLTAVEGLGSCTYIASDKTGTLTVNEQTLKVVIAPDGSVWRVRGQGYNDNGKVFKDDETETEPDVFDSDAWFDLLGVDLSLCNEAGLYKKNEEWKHYGDAVDVAFLAFAMKLGLNPRALQKEADVLHRIPFESELKYAAVFYRKGDKVRIAVKGAVEILIPMCNAFYGREKDFDEALIVRYSNKWTADGFRVIAVCGGEIDEKDFNHDDLQSNLLGLDFMGITCLIDPLRKEVAHAVKRCHQAGITVAMVTGDHPLTAFNIATALDLSSNKDDLVTGAELLKAGDADSDSFKELVVRKNVFARVSPLQKEEITGSLAASGHFVAVTGDGVNDVPALRKAHIGVAMGSGTDLAKETADIIITDDNFKSIEAGVEEGRVAYDNIRKVTLLLISTGAAEILIFLLSLLVGVPLPLTAVQLLWLNLVTNGIQDVALAFEGAEPGVMKRKPRDPREGIFDRPMIEQTLIGGATIGLLGFSLWYYMIEVMDYDELHARTLTLMFMVLMENIHVFNCRSESLSAFKVPLSRNWWIVGGVLVAQGIHQLATRIPFMQNVLTTDNVAWDEWFKLLGLSMIVLLVMEVYKIIKR